LFGADWVKQRTALPHFDGSGAHLPSSKGEFEMTLQSKLFRGDARLEAAAVSDAAHIVPGSRGPHVAKIQTALNRLDSAGLDVDGAYGPQTASAVLAYKSERAIINRSYQKTPDNIVGKMTMASLDKEMQADDLGPLEITTIGDEPIVNVNPLRGRPFLRLAFGLDAGIADAGTPNLRFSTKLSRWAPGVTGTVHCAQTANSSLAVCTNEQDPSRDGAHPVVSKIAFLSDSAAPSNIALFPKPEEGGRVPLTLDPQDMRLETFRPGDATIVVTRGDTVRMLIVEVRQDAKGPVAGPALTKLTANSRFFSASRAEGGEGVDPEGIFSGRPVNPKRGGRLINLGGETETPEFEDYQIDLDHSLGGHGGFRPWVGDFESPTTFVPSQSASHITMRGTPLLDPFIKEIKRIAQPGCRFTFNGNSSFLPTIKAKLPGRELETPLLELNGTFVLLAWELN
jgi:hypothetical protein